MNRAEYIFKEILKNKESAIDNFILNLQFENLFLDFKCIATQDSEKALNDSDRKNYAKAISGFGNSEGGVIVWGVGCKQGAKGDVATDKQPIGNPQKFASMLESITSGSTLPPHNNVRNEVIVTDDGKGFIVTFVPKSENTPHQAITGDKKYYYYIRVGSSFEPAPHSVLAGMFGRRPQPKLCFCFHTIQLQLNQSDQSIKFSFFITIENQGPSLAHLLYLTLKIAPKPENIHVKYNLLSDDFNLTKAISDLCASVVSDNSFYLPPNGIVHIIKYEIDLFKNIDDDFALSGSVGAENCPPILFRLYNEKDNLNALYNEIITNYDTYKKDQKDEICMRLLKSEIFTNAD